MKKHKIGIKVGVVVAGSLLLATTTGVFAAQAATFALSGELNNDGSLVQYGTYRYDNGGANSFECTNSVGNYNGQAYFKLGLRNAGNTQITNSPEWSSSGETHAFKTTAGSSSVPAANYAINGRMQESGVVPTNWAGNMTW